MLRRLTPWLLPAAILIGWEIASRSGTLSARILPEPAAVLAAFWRLLLSGELAHHVAVSTARAFSALAIGGGLGLALGLLTGTWQRAEALLDTTLQMLRNIPALALIPLVILWFGIDEAAKLVLVVRGRVLPGLPEHLPRHPQRRPRPHRDGAQLRAERAGSCIAQVILPGALPSILVGLRFSLGLMWVLLIVAETLSAQAGIGYLTMNAREFLQTDIVLVGILLYALLGKLADVVARASGEVPGCRGTRAMRAKEAFDHVSDRIRRTRAAT